MYIADSDQGVTRCWWVDYLTTLNVLYVSEVLEVSTWNEVVCCCVFIVHWAYLLVVILRCLYEKRDIHRVSKK